MTTFLIKWVDLSDLGMPVQTSRVRGLCGEHAVERFYDDCEYAEIIHIVAAA